MRIVTRNSNDLYVLLRHRLLRKSGGFEGFGGVHVPLHADDAPLMQIEDGRRIDLKLDPALAALVFALENNYPVASIDELLGLDPVVIPYLVEFRIEGLKDLAKPTQDFAFLKPPTVPWSSTFGSTRSVIPRQSLRSRSSDSRRTISTFSCDIAYSCGPRASTASLQSG